MGPTMDGRVCVVTGGGQGIGRAACTRLAAEGARVAVWEINPETAGEVAAELGDGHLAVVVDVSDSESVASAAARTRQELGKVDVLVNNAAYVSSQPPLVEMGDEQWERSIGVNLGGQFKCLRALAPDMIEAKSGSIVNVAAMGAFTGLRTGPGAYAASKGGVIALTYAASAQLAAHGIRVNAVVPGTTETPRAAAMPPARREELFTQIMFRPNGGEPRMAQPDEVAQAIWFFASPLASWITGASLVCSGGQLMR
jgi:2-hydroxycyclohexanecarboxyl-CoA dehydrogenase